MTPLYYLAEIAATLTENVVAISAVTAAAGQRYQGKKHLAVIWLLAAMMVIPITMLNMIQAFSYLTVVAALVCVICGTKITSIGSLLFRMTACIIIYFLLHSLQSILMFIFALFINSSSSIPDALSSLTAPGKARFYFVFFVKALEIVLYWPIKRVMPVMKKLSHNQCTVLLFLSALTYGVMLFVFNAITFYSVFPTQFIVIFCWLLFSLCFALFFSIVVMVSNYLNERRSNELLQMTNVLMTQNYRELHQEQQTFSRQLHDFKHHLMALRGLLSAGKGGEAEDYLDSLLDGTYREARQCHSGSDIIDAILNCKLAQARLEGIDLSFEADFPLRTNLLDADICGVLANQLDNAFDACRRLPADKPREIRAEVRQVRSFAFFQVENSVAENPLLHNRELRSTKQGGSPLHGIGLRNIREIATKYDGSVRHEYKDGRFLSVVTLCFEEAER